VKYFNRISAVNVGSQPNFSRFLLPSPTDPDYNPLNSHTSDYAAWSYTMSTSTGVAQKSKPTTKWSKIV